MENQFLHAIQNATLVAKLVLGILVCMSFVSWSLILYKFFALRQALSLVTYIEGQAKLTMDLETIVQLSSKYPESPTFAIAKDGLQEWKRVTALRLDKSLIADNTRRALHGAISVQLSALTSSLSFLASAGNAAPFIGLFGTVWGIMHSFGAIAKAQSASLATVAPGIAEALIATAIGLFVAIPASVAYNYFLRKCELLELHLVNFAGVFLNRVQSEDDSFQ